MPFESLEKSHLAKYRKIQPLFGRQVFLTLTDVNGHSVVPTSGTVMEGTEYQFFDHNIEFTVENSLGFDPNSATISIYNPTVHTAKRIQEAVFVELHAGYGSSPKDLASRHGSIFSGDIRRAVAAYDGPNIVVTLEAGDAEVAYDQELTRGYRKGADLFKVLKDLVDTMGIEAGDLDSIKTWLNNPILSSIFNTHTKLPHGLTVGGTAADTLQDLLDSLGFAYSVHKGVFTLVGVTLTPRWEEAPVFQPFGRVVGKQQILLDALSGLIGAPSVDRDGTIEVASLLNPEIIPASSITVASKLSALMESPYRGPNPSADITQFQTSRVVHSGGVFSSDFVTEIEGRPVWT